MEYSALKELSNTNARRWSNDVGDVYNRLNYPNLTPDSVILDVGGYLGQFSASMLCKYSSNIYLFEPVAKFFNACCFRFNGNNKVKCIKYGLSNRCCPETIYIANDASSIFPIEGSCTETIQLITPKKFIADYSINIVDLLKINIEGAEYDLLDYIISHHDIINKIKNIQVQFHIFVQNAEERRERIITRLEKTHKLTWRYDWVWENWELR